MENADKYEILLKYLKKSNNVKDNGYNALCQRFSYNSDKIKLHIQNLSLMENDLIKFRRILANYESALNIEQLDMRMELKQIDKNIQNLLTFFEKINRYRYN